MDVLHPRCCGIDVHKTTVVACLRLQDGRRVKMEIQQFGTTTAELLRLHAWLSAAACTHVAMESTSVYWKPVFNLLEGSFEVVLANAHHIKAVPGRKTDAKDCEWLANLLAHGSSDGAREEEKRAHPKRFTESLAIYSREDSPAELGAGKVYKIPLGPLADKAVGRLKIELEVLSAVSSQHIVRLRHADLGSRLMISEYLHHTDTKCGINRGI